MNGFPILEPPEKPLANERTTVNGAHPEPAEAHLRSAQAVNGYPIKARDGTIGHVCYFVMGAQSWEIGQLVIKTGHRLSGKAVLIPTKKVDYISYEESTVFVNLGGEAVEQSPAQHLVSDGAAD
jgi:hypothetical protein